MKKVGQEWNTRRRADLGPRHDSAHHNSRDDKNFGGAYNLRGLREMLHI
ncbi:hypothetical protein Mp_zg01310 [Marchantia polymorpha subsp. ruderalis]|uniref:Uncharacterized protein n=2 Tax=Marchantia polymorpha TaxID=3197 RepID=A0A679E193_MARPO|nr:hypothetical protein MARPO_0047s0050 [Marchantia polymorpha]BBN20776.1 hypothetical protein Mp_zg01310 [Marchantia polymorpha subsp. ruderalis]|eukprot:PTQ39068.1 hypothetical protein MARPO_0047s0050 [Marchantia polymorpha]